MKQFFVQKEGQTYGAHVFFSPRVPDILWVAFFSLLLFLGAQKREAAKKNGVCVCVCVGSSLSLSLSNVAPQDRGGGDRRGLPGGLATALGCRGVELLSGSDPFGVGGCQGPNRVVRFLRFFFCFGGGEGFKWRSGWVLIVEPAERETFGGGSDSPEKVRQKSFPWFVHRWKSGPKCEISPENSVRLLNRETGNVDPKTNFGLWNPKGRLKTGCCSRFYYLVQYGVEQGVEPEVNRIQWVFDCISKGCFLLASP